MNKLSSFTLFVLIVCMPKINLSAKTNKQLLQRSTWKLANVKEADYNVYQKFTGSSYTISFRSSYGNIDTNYPYILSKTKGTKNLSFDEQKSKNDDMGTFIICENPKSKEVQVYEVIKLTTDSLIMRYVMFPGEVRIGGGQPVKYIAVPEVGK